MRNLKTLMIIVLGMVALTFTSCEKEEINPINNSNEDVYYVGYWEFQSGTIVDQNDNAYTYDEMFCQTIVTGLPIFNLEYEVNSDKTGKQLSPCFGSEPLTYKATFSSEKLTGIEFNSGNAKMGEYDDIVYDEINKTLTMNKPTYIANAKKVTYTFKVVN